MVVGGRPAIGLFCDDRAIGLGTRKEASKIILIIDY